MKKKTANRVVSKTALLKRGDPSDPLLQKLTKIPENDYSDVKAAPFVSPEFGKGGKNRGGMAGSGLRSSSAMAESSELRRNLSTPKF